MLKNRMLIRGGKTVGDRVVVARRRRRMQPRGLAWHAGIAGGSLGRAVFAAQGRQPSMKTPGECLRATPTAAWQEGADETAGGPASVARRIRAAHLEDVGAGRCSLDLRVPALRRRGRGRGRVAASTRRHAVRIVVLEKRKATDLGLS